MVIKKNMNMGHVVKNYPETVQVMLNYGIECIGCHIATWETLEQAAEDHGIDVELMVRDMNRKAGGEA
jgi:hybrid cluster-associated redox disulfide protein